MGEITRRSNQRNGLSILGHCEVTIEKDLTGSDRFVFIIGEQNGRI